MADLTLINSEKDKQMPATLNSDSQLQASGESRVEFSPSSWVTPMQGSLKCAPQTTEVPWVLSYFYNNTYVIFMC